ncbi:CC180 protein, partial [Polypterus senegalus]
MPHPEVIQVPDQLVLIAPPGGADKPSSVVAGSLQHPLAATPSPNRAAVVDSMSHGATGEIEEESTARETAPKRPGEGIAMSIMAPRYIANYTLNSSPDRVTPDELYTFTLTIMEKVNECCRFLGCLLDLDSATSVPESPLQGSFAIAARYQSFKQEAMVTFQNDGLLQPSRMGKPAVEDVALRVIQNILQTQKTRVIVELPEDSAEKAQGGTASAPANQTTAQSTSRPGSVVYFNQTKSSSSSSDPKNAGVGRTSSTSIKRFRKPTRFDKRFQVFGPKVEEEPTNFKEVITAILWESNDVLLALAEEFYKKKDKRPITRPEFLPESFENCGEMLNQKLLVYQKQVDDYYNCCVLDFRQQVTEFEQQLPLVPRLMIENLGSKYLKDMEAIVSQAKQAFVGPQRELDAKQAEYWNLLRPRVGHPASASQLDSLCDLEKQRQREQLRLIDMSEGEVRVCVLKQAEEFAHALATLTECILLKLDEFLTVDEIQPGTVESASQRTCTLIRRKQSGFPLEMKEQDVPLIQRGSRLRAQQSKVAIGIYGIRTGNLPIASADPKPQSHHLLLDRVSTFQSTEAHRVWMRLWPATKDKAASRAKHPDLLLLEGDFHQGCGGSDGL